MTSSDLCLSLLADGVPLTLLLDLASPEGPMSTDLMQLENDELTGVAA